MSDTPGVRHVPPFFCPYCGEEDIAPHGDDAGGWSCGSCLRAFVLRSARVAVATRDQEVTA